MRSSIQRVRNDIIVTSILILFGSLAACSENGPNGDGGQPQAGTGGTGPTGGVTATGGVQDAPTSGQSGTVLAATGGQPSLDSGTRDGQTAQDSATAGNNQTAQDSALIDSQATRQDSAPIDSQTGDADASTVDAAADSADSGQAGSVTIHYWVQSCFSITAEGGVTVVTDPYTPSPTVEAQAVTVSHEHPDHNNVDGVPGTFEVLRSESGVGQHEVAGITFTGVATFHDNAGGSQRGNNTVFVWEMQGIRFAHLGDLGHLLTDEQIQQIGAVDVLMIPTGGGFTIDAPTAVQVAQQLSPKLVIPMHNQMFGGAGPFLDAVPEAWTVEQPGSASITVTAADFAADTTKVVVLVP